MKTDQQLTKIINEQSDDPLRTRREFAEQGKFGLKTLQRLEARGEAPPHVEIATGMIRYRQSAIDAWFAERTRRGKKAKRGSDV